MGIHDGHREKMRLRYRKSGLEAFAEHEALELLLYYAIPRRDTNPIAHRLMERYGSLSAVLTAPVEDLMQVEGVGESAAILLHLVPEVWKKARLEEAGRETVLNSSERAGKLSAGALRRGDHGGHLPALSGPQRETPCLQAPGGGRRLRGGSQYPGPGVQRPADLRQRGDLIP